MSLSLGNSKSSRVPSVGVLWRRLRRFLFCRSRAITVCSAAPKRASAPGFRMNPSLRNQHSRDFRKAAGTRPQRATATNSRSEGPNVQPAMAGQVPSEIFDQLLDPALWRRGLGQFALATNVAVQLFD